MNKQRFFKLQEVDDVKRIVLVYQMLEFEVCEPVYTVGELAIYYDAVEGHTYESTILDIKEENTTFLIEMHEHTLCIPNPSFPSFEDPSSTSFRHETPLMNQ